MIKRLMIVATLLPSAALAAVPVLTPNPQAPSEQSLRAAVVSAHGAWAFEQLSMGPDPGGHTGATVTPETSKTGQPSQDAAGASNQTGAKSNSATDAETNKQPADNSGRKSSNTPEAPTTPSTAGQSQPSKDR